MHGFPLNIMYFVDRKNGEYEVLDGQQRIIFICKYVTNPVVSAEIPAVTGGYNLVNFNNLDVGQLVVAAGYEMDWSVFNQNTMRDASVAAECGDLRKFRLYIQDGLSVRNGKTVVENSRLAGLSGLLHRIGCSEDYDFEFDEF